MMQFKKIQIKSQVFIEKKIFINQTTKKPSIVK